MLDVGLSVLWSDVVIVYPRLQSWIAGAINTVIIKPIATAYLVSWILTEVAVQAGMWGGASGFTIALLASIGLKLALLGMSWDSAESLKGSFVGNLFSWAYGFIDTLKRIADLGIKDLKDFLALSGANFWRLLYKFIWIPLNMIFLVNIVQRVVTLGGWQL